MYVVVIVRLFFLSHVLIVIVIDNAGDLSSLHLSVVDNQRLCMLPPLSCSILLFSYTRTKCIYDSELLILIILRCSVCPACYEFEIKPKKKEDSIGM